MAKLKGVLNAGLKALLASAETNAGLKFATTFISELAALPDDKQKDIAGLSQEQFNQLLNQSELAACDAKQAKALVENFADKALEMLEDIVELLRKELAFKNDQIGFLQGQIERSQLPEPSPRAHELAEQISDDAEPYALALKAIAEKRYDDARRYLAEAQDQKEADLAKIYSSRGETEIYTGNFIDAAAWYEKAINLAPDDRSIWESASLVYYHNAQYDQAEPLIRRSLSIDESSFGPDHPNVAIRLNNLATLLQATNRLDEAKPLIKRALAIDESSFGPEHPVVARDLNNLAALLQATNRLDEAEPLMRRALSIDESSFGADHPNVAGDMNNLAGLLKATNRLDEAEPLMRRALAIDESSFGANHPIVAIRLNNLAALLQATNRLDEAEPLIKLVVEIFLKFTRQTGHKHPHLDAAINNYYGLLASMGCSEDEIKARLKEMQ